MITFSNKSFSLQKEGFWGPRLTLIATASGVPLEIPNFFKGQIPQISTTNYLLNFDSVPDISEQRAH